MEGLSINARWLLGVLRSQPKISPSLHFTSSTQSLAALRRRRVPWQGIVHRTRYGWRANDANPETKRATPVGDSLLPSVPFHPLAAVAASTWSERRSGGLQQREPTTRAKSVRGRGGKVDGGGVYLNLDTTEFYATTSLLYSGVSTSLDLVGEQVGSPL